MTHHTRQVVLDALDKAIGLRNDPTASKALLRDGDLDLTGIGLDSLTVMEVIMAVEEALDIELDTDVLDDHPMLNDLARVLAAEHAKRT